ncbi:hypothetical protein [Streptomyces sp. ALI-76-A]|uniref:hypothetical protein n=1 Tax=Streptomyces sp. ALI-76-A TaxID=3025736 RepID=UPI00256F53A5|nr:hypothetical protein [Streptomyces sp. ALI-76-A]MDL5206319.1 hypothetical protein [Streptomyces sp. ALI-76-A]
MQHERAFGAVCPGRVQKAGLPQGRQHVGAFGQPVGVQPLLALLLQLHVPEFFFGFGGSGGFGGELVLDDGVGLQAVGPAGGGEQLRDALPLADFGGAAFVVGQVLAVAVDVLLQPGVLEGGRGLGGGHAGGASVDPAAADLRPVDRLAGRGRAGCGDTGTAAGSGHGGAHTSLSIVTGKKTGYRCRRTRGAAVTDVPKRAGCHQRERLTWCSAAAKHGSCHRISRLFVTISALSMRVVTGPGAASIC